MEFTLPKLRPRRHHVYIVGPKAYFLLLRRQQAGSVRSGSSPLASSPSRCGHFPCQETGTVVQESELSLGFPESGLFLGFLGSAQMVMVTER